MIVKLRNTGQQLDDDIRQERAAAVETLAASELRYRRLFETAKDGILILDAETGMIVDVNPFLVTLLGYSHETFLGKKIWELGFFNDIVANQENFTELQQKEYIRYEDKALEGRDGQRHEVEFVSNVYQVNSHKVIQCNIRDITERKQAEAKIRALNADLERRVEERMVALRENEERFCTLANNISQLAWMADAQGSIFWYNQRWFDYTGTTLEEMHGWGWQKVHHPDHVQRVVDKIKHCFETGEVWEDTFPLRGRDGEYRWFLSRAVPTRDEHGMVLRWFGTNTDVTERKSHEAEVHQLNDQLSQHATALQAANKELEAFSYSVSHDLRAPLRSTDGFSRLLLEKYGDKLDATGKDYLQRMRAASQRMAELIDDLLALAQVSRAEMKRESVDLSALARSITSGGTLP